MNTQNKHTRGQWRSKRNSRWQWMVGATAATAATATGVQAQLVEINLIGDQVTGPGTVQLNPDLTGTGPTVLGLTGRANYFSGGGGKHTGSFHGNYASLHFNAPERGVASNKVSARALLNFNISASTTHFYANINNVGKSAKFKSKSGYPTAKATLFIPIALTSSNVNGGTLTNALLEVTSLGSGPNTETVALTKLVYDLNDPTVSTATLQADVKTGNTGVVIGTTKNGVYTPTAVPEPEPSGLALLALGAGGLIARRLCRKVA